jgi:flagellar hook-associated protein 1 FlgK
MTIPGTFFGLNIGLSGLNSSQAAQVVTGNNISNAGTTGYTNETADIVTGPEGPTTGPSSQDIASTFGSGSIVNTISRAADAYLDQEVNNAQSQSSSDSALSTALGDVQDSFNEPSTSGISAGLTTFFNDVDNLENSPSDLGVRTTVINDGVALAQVIQTVQGNLTSNASSVSTNITQDVSQINSIGQQIAALNVQIQSDQAQNIQPNTLLDQRGLLVSNLSQITNITTATSASGAMNVSIGSTQLVSGTTANSITLSSLQSRGDLTSGSLSGLTTAQTSIAGYQTSLDTLANTIITSVNQVQESGMGLDGSTGVAFFTGTNASTIAVNPTLINNPNQLAAAAAVSPPATTPAPGDASNAVLLGNIATTTQAALGNQTIQGSFNTTITELGAQTQAAQTSATDSAASTTQLTNQQSTVEGVSIDTQMSNMMIFQRAYQASAQFISTESDMLNSLVNVMFAE